MYHELMAGRRQDPSFESSGRVNQKRRTRAAIVAAGRAILHRGETPTVALVAEEAQMTRTTVYRYFPSQESLLLELSVTVSIDEIDDVP
jgi:AcrR family transcriptional regulator